MTKTIRLSLFATTLGLAVAVATVAEAHPAHGGDAKHHAKHHKSKHMGKRFEKADKNGDGFLTKDEVGDKRWARISVADANDDGKVSRAEIQKAHEEGKLRGKHKKGKRGGKEA